MKIERKYMAHYLNAAFGSGDASYTRLGSDLEEYSPELTANVEKKSNIVGETTVTINGYQKQGEVSPYYAEAGDPLFERLQAIIDEQGRGGGVPRRARGMLHRGRQLRRRHHRLPNPVQRALHRRQDEGHV